MTPDPIPHAPESASEVLRSLEWIWPTSAKGIKQCPCCYGWKSEGHIPDCRLAAALANPTPTPSSDGVAELRAMLQRAQEAAMDLGRQRDAALAQAIAAEARVKVLEEALRPFAELYPHRDEPDHWPAFGKRAGEGWPTVGDFRRAARMMEAKR